MEENGQRSRVGRKADDLGHTTIQGLGRLVGTWECQALLSTDGNTGGACLSSVGGSAEVRWSRVPCDSSPCDLFFRVCNSAKISSLKN